MSGCGQGESSAEGRPLDGQGEPPLGQPQVGPREGSPVGEGRNGLDGMDPAIRSGKGCLKSFMVGCLTVVVLLAVLGYVVFRNIRSISANIVREHVVGIVNESGLSWEQREGVILQIDRVVEAFKRRRVTVEDVTRLAGQVTEGTLIPLAMLAVAEKKYVAASDMDDAEKAGAALAIQRFARGVAEGRVSRDEVRSVLGRITWTTPEGDTRMLEELSGERLRGFVSEAEQAADAAGIPSEPHQVDFAAEACKIVDQFLEETAKP